MVHAYVMVKSASGESEPVLGAICNLAAVADAHVVAGEYDVIAELDAEDVYEVLSQVSQEIGGLSGVTDTRTYVALG